MQSTIHEVLINRDELARRMGVSEATIERWTRARFIPSYAFGRRCVRYDAEAVKAALAKFQRLALRRLPRGNYQPRREKPKFRFEADQLELRFERCDPAQLELGLAPPNPTLKTVKTDPA